MNVLQKRLAQIETVPHENSLCDGKEHDTWYNETKVKYHLNEEYKILSFKERKKQSHLG